MLSNRNSQSNFHFRRDSSYAVNGNIAVKPPQKTVHTVEIDYTPAKAEPYFHFLKRTFDIVCSLFILAFFMPLWIVVAIAVKINSHVPAIYRQKRVGKNGKIFTLYKFRSMIDNAEKYTGPVWAIKDDLRITRIGSIIRKVGIDEVLQFINVLKGEMSIIGPRPERGFFVHQFNKTIPNYKLRLKVLPGITGLAQIKHKYDASIEDVIKKLEFDMKYISNLSLKNEFIIIVLTTYTLITGKGKF